MAFKWDLFTFFSGKLWTPKRTKQSFQELRTPLLNALFHFNICISSLQLVNNKYWNSREKIYTYKQLFFFSFLPSLKILSEPVNMSCLCLGGENNHSIIYNEELKINLIYGRLTTYKPLFFKSQVEPISRFREYCMAVNYALCIFNVFFCFLFFHNDFHIITNYGLRLLERIISGADLISIFFFSFLFF